MAFDSKAYKKDVLVPLAKDKTRSADIDTAIRELSQGGGAAAIGSLDLREILAIGPNVPDDLRGHIKALQSSLNKWGRNPPSADKARLLIKAALEANVGLEDPEFWARHDAARNSAQSAALKAFVTGLAQEHPLGVLSAEALEGAARGAGFGGIPSAELRSAAERGGLTIVAEVDAPPVVVPPILSSAIEHPEFRTLIDLITYPDRAADASFLDALTSGGTVLTMAQVHRAHARAESARDSDAVQDAQKALGLLRKACATDADLHRLVRAAVLKHASGLVKPGGSRVAQRDQLTTAGIHAVDAARTVLHLNPMGTGGAISAAQLIARALGQGDLAEARRLAGALPEDAEEAAERKTVIAQLDAAESRKGDLVTEADQAIARRDFAAAEKALAQAAAIDTCDDDLGRRRAALPPARPDGLRARATERGVELNWSSVVGDGVRYRVLRGEGAPPVDPAAGRAVVPETAATSAVDPQAPIAREIHFAVFATRDGHTFSDPAVVSVTALPPVTGLSVTADASRVALAWTAPSAALGAMVEVHAAGSQPITQEVPTAAYTAQGLELGRRYTFVVRALYAVGGRRVISEPVQIEASPRGELTAPQAFAIASVDRPGEDVIRATWREVPGYEVELWVAPLGLDVVAGSPLPLAELERRGGRRLTPLPGRESSGGVVTVEYAASGIAAYVAVTVDGARGVPGETTVAGIAPSVTDFHTERLGDAVRLSWVWPDDDLLVELRWLQDGAPRSRRVTRAKYANDGGVTLSHAAGISAISIATVVRGQDDEWTSAPVSVPFSAARPRIGYSVAISRGIFRAPTATVTLEPGEFSGSMDVELVLSTDSFLPSTPQSGEVLRCATFDLEAHTPLRFEQELPKKIPSPYWLRLFATGSAPALLVDPPHSQMKG